MDRAALRRQAEARGDAEDFALDTSPAPEEEILQVSENFELVEDRTGIKEAKPNVDSELGKVIRQHIESCRNQSSSKLNKKVTAFGRMAFQFQVKKGTLDHPSMVTRSAKDDQRFSALKPFPYPEQIQSLLDEVWTDPELRRKKNSEVQTEKIEELKVEDSSRFARDMTDSDGSK
jgi:hypothetical protein